MAVRDAASGTQGEHVRIDILNVVQAALLQHFGKAQVEVAARQRIV